jgi:Zn-dependent M16 (insulinase) family peptidase
VKESLSEADIDHIIESTRKLKEAQEKEDSPEAKASLPRLSLTDIERTAKVLPIEVEKLSDATILTHSVQSNGILYTDIAFDFSDINEDDLVLLPLLSRMLTETGTTDLSEDALTYLIGAETGGIGASFSVDLKSNGGKVSDPNDVSLYFAIRGKCTPDKISTLFDLVKKVLLDSNLTNQRRAVEMIKETKVRRETQIITSGHTYAASRLSARYSLVGYINERTGGLTYVRDLATLLEQAEKDWPSVERRLIALRDNIVAKSQTDRLIVNLTGEDKILASAKPVVTQFLNNLPTKTSTTTNLVSSFQASKLLPMQNEGFAVPSQVNYVVKGGSVFSPGESVKASYNVVVKYLSTGYLWDNVRVMGGAYGGFARFGASSGRMMFMSYRDPNLVDTLNIYDGASNALTAAEITQEDVLQAIIGSIGDMDSPLSPDQKGSVSMAQYIAGETNEDRQRMRDEVIDTTPSDFKDLAKRMESLKTKGSVAIFGSQAALDQANEALPADSKLKIELAIPIK